MKVYSKNTKLNLQIAKTLFLLMLLYVLSPENLSASFEDIEIGARATSLAGSFVSQADDMSGIFYNPAGMARLKRHEIFSSYGRKYWGLTDNSIIDKQVVGYGMPFKFGTIGIAGHMLKLDSLYREDMIKLGYSRKIKKKYYGGLNLSLYRIGYGETNYTRINPVFDNGYSKTAFGVDLGFIYTGYVYDLGLSVLNINSPDVGLKYENKVPLRVNTGVTMKWRVLNLNFTGVYSPGMVKLKAGIETWLYKRLVSLRGGLNVGTLKYRNAAIGFGYKVNHYEVDYAFTYPLSGLSDTYGSHQLSFTYRFGREEEEKAFTWKDLIELARAGEYRKEELKEEIAAEEEKKVITPEEIAQAQDYVIKAKEDFEKGLYDAGMEKIYKAKAVMPDDQEVTDLMKKGSVIIPVIARVDGRSKKSRLLRKGIKGFIYGNAKTSLNSIRYASQLWPRDKAITSLRTVVEREFSDLAESEQMVPGINLTDLKLQQALELIYGQKYVAAVSLCMEVIDIEPNNVLALMRMGSSYWAMGRTEKAKKVWMQALEYDPDNEQLLEFLKMKKKPSRPAVKKKKAKPRKADENTMKEYSNGVNYYKRVKRYGASKDTLKSILMRMVDKFEDKGVDISFIKKELKQYK